MVFLNYSTMQMVAKIVYYGPGLCGKTTNLKQIYRKTSPKSRGEMVSLETETDRTLFFDLLPMDVGVVGGFKTKFQLYTVPGQVFYNSTRKLVLKGVDGVVFVVDSQEPMLEANRNSFDNLCENLAELGLSLGDIPLVFQFNKRDLPNLTSVAGLNEALNQDGRPFIEASAINGKGVFETLKEISRLTLVKLRAKASGDEPKPRREQAKLTVQSDNRQRIKEEIRSHAGDFSVDLEEETQGNVPVDELPAHVGEALPESVTFDTGDETVAMSADSAEELSNGLPNISSPAMDVMPGGSIDDSFEALDEQLEDLNDFDLDFPDEDDTESDEDSLEMQGFEDFEGDGPDLSAGPESPTKPAVPAAQALLRDSAEARRQQQRIIAKSNPDKRQALASSLQEIESLATQIVTSKTAKQGDRKSGSVDALLEDLVGDDGKRRGAERHHIKTRRPFSKAQLNCVLLDDNESVVHAQLIKVAPKMRGPGKYRIHLAIDVDVDE